MFKFDESMYGRQVRFVNAKAHEEMPWCYPEVGTVGVVVPVNGTDFEGLVDDFAVQWPEESTEYAGVGTRGDCWLVDEESLELVEEIVDKI